MRTLCPVHACKVPGDIDNQFWQEWLASIKIDSSAYIVHPVSHLEYRNAGYKGRLGIYEILQSSDKIQPAITASPDTGELRRLAMKDGMRTLRLSGAQKVAAGLTTIEEIMRVAPQPFDL